MTTGIVLPFLMSMLLGRTIDLRTYSVGEGIYDNANYKQEPIIQPGKSVITTYYVLQNNSIPHDFFGVPADIAFRIKNNFLSSASGIMGLDGMLKDTSWKYNSVVVGIISICQTVERKLTENRTEIPNWENRVPKTQTHYADSLFYGGWLVVLVRFKCDIAGDVPIVRKAITNSIGVIGEVRDNIEELYSKVDAVIKDNRDIRGSVQVSQYVYSSIPLSYELNNAESLSRMLREFQGKVGAVGQPLFMTLQPIHDLDESYPKVKENLAMLSEFQKMDDMMDDLKLTKVNMMRWGQESLKTFSDEEEEKIAELLNKINQCLREFSKINGEVSLYKSTDKSAFASAIKKYEDGLEGGVENYNLAYRKLKEEIDAECDNKFLHKIRGLLKVYDSEMQAAVNVTGGLKECKDKCRKNDACRAIGFASKVLELDIKTGLYYKKHKQCWIYFRSTSTATVHTPVGLSGDMSVYDRNCYLR